MDHMSTGDAARRLSVAPKIIKDLFYQRELRDDLCPIIAGRRMIPETHLETIKTALIKRGKRSGEVPNV